MKRNRMEEVPFGPARNTGGPTAHHRIMPTQHAVQYTLTPGVLKSGNTETINISSQPTSNIPYASSYTNTTSLAGSLAKSGVQVQANQGQLHTIPANTSNTIRHKTVTTPGVNVPTNLGISTVNVGVPTTVNTPIQQQQQTVQAATPPQATGGQSQFQRLKVEDALSYLDQVKYKFGNQPQVYNDFLDIMKEFKSQSIDTPGVIERVSNLFKGHPELIVGFNTFLPPGYKIEVQANDQGYAFQVSYSVEGGGAGQTIQSQSSPPQKMQILQGSAQIVHSMPTTATAVNLMTHSHQQPMHVTNIQQIQQQQQPPQQQSQQSQQSQQVPQPPQQQQTVSSIAIPQNYSRDRINTGANIVSSGNVTTVQHSVNQQQQQQHLSQQQQQQPLSDVSNQTIGGLQRIQQAHQQMLSQPDPGNSTQNQPVEFNHAINYVNKIKNRFQSQPEKYKRFLEILHTYQKEQKTIKEGAGINVPGGVSGGGGGGVLSQGKQLTENEVYTQVAKLFDNNDDLLREFGQFLPDATSHASTYHHIAKSHVLNDHNKKMTSGGGGSGVGNQHPTLVSVGSKSSYNSGGGLGGQNNMSRMERDYSHHYNNDKDYNSSREKEQRHHLSGPNKYHHGSPVKRSPSAYNTIPLGHNMPQSVGSNRGGDLPQPPPPKRYKPICRDVTLAEASKYGTLHDFAFFDKVRKALRSPDVYDNFLRCLTLFNQEIISKSELLNLVTPFLSKFPDLLRWFQDFLGQPSSGVGGSSGGSTGLSLGGAHVVDGPSEGVCLPTVQRQERTQSEIVYEIDLTTCKRLGASYCALPKSSEIKKCSGRTPLCKEVLNDTWVSFPTYAEDSTFVTSRKTQYEEFIYRCEDERFELDVVIETNRATIHALEGVQKKLNRMSPDEVSRFRLDDNLGGTSPTIHQRTLRRIYGDKTNEIITGLKKSPLVAVPVVLRRLKAKEEEWREAQKGFNKQWREQNEKYYLKSLDHQGINFKQNDTKALRSKNLFNEIETLYEERHEQNEEGGSGGGEVVNGPHLILPYKDKTILDDAANLLIHHVKRQTGIQKQEKARIKHIMRQFVPDMFFAPRQQLSDDEREDVFPFSADDKMDVDTNDGKSSPPSTRATTSKEIVLKEDTTTVFSSAIVSITASTIASAPTATSVVSDLPVKSEKSGSERTTQDSSSSLCNSNSNKVSNASKSDVNSNNSNDSNNATTCVDQIKVEVKDESEKDSSGVAGAATASTATTTNQQIPLHAVSKYPEEAYTLFFANSSWYLFLRLHAILCGRLRTMYERAQILIEEEKQYRGSRRESTAIALRLKPKSEIQVEDYYSTFLDMLKNVLDGNMDANNYEDSLREMFGIHAYIAFTLDKVVSYAVRQLQHCVTERGALDCVEMFQLEQKKSGAGGPCKIAQKRIAAELAYQRKAEASLQDENCFKVFIYKIDCRVTIELLDTESEEQTTNTVANSQAWSSYVERYANPNATGTTTNQSSDQNIEIKTETTDDDMSNVSPKHAFLRRNIRKTKQKILKDKHSLLSTSVPAPTSESSSTTTTTATSITAATATVDSSVHESISLETTAVTSTISTSSTTSTTSTSTATISISATVDIEKNSITTNGKPSASATTVANPNNVNLHRMADADNLNRLEETLANRRPAERVGGLPQTLYYIDDQEQVKVNINTFKLYYIQGKDIQFYKRNSLRRAHQTHSKVTLTKHKKFQKFVQNWLAKNATELQRTDCNDWLMGHKSDLITNKTILKQDNDLTKTPYIVYNRYRVENVTNLNVSTTTTTTTNISSS